MLVNLATVSAERATHPLPSFEFPSGDARRLELLSLEQQKKRAKELLRQLRAGETSALARLQQAQPKAVPSAEGVRLSDAQNILAHEHGFSRWSDFHAHIEQARIARQAIAQGAPTALDGDRRTLHIRCGNDILHSLAIAGFTGDFLVFADPYVQGPVPQTKSLEGFLRIRAEFLAPWAGSKEAALARLKDEYGALERAGDYSRVALWFEHDSYDQLILARLLAHFAQTGSPPRNLQLVNVSHFPGVKRFQGLGHLPPDALRLVWRDFAEVTGPQLSLGQRAWEALTSPSPEGLEAIAQSGTSALPALAPALKRHLRELPSENNGLGLTEELTLKVLTEKGPLQASKLFGWYQNHYEPLPFWGDLQYWKVLSGLAQAARPALSIAEPGASPSDWHVQITALGEKLLEGSANWLDENHVRRWVGGVFIDSRKPPVWCFEVKSNRVRPRR